MENNQNQNNMSGSQPNIPAGQSYQQAGQPNAPAGQSYQQAGQPNAQAGQPYQQPGQPNIPASQPNMQQQYYGWQQVGGAVPPPGYYPPVQKPKTKETMILKNNFGKLGLASFLYACFYALCMYRNSSGITYPFFLAGSFWFYCFCMKKLEISLKKDSIFYAVSILLLGISTFCTADGRIIFMNKTGIWILTISFLLHNFFKDKNWTFGRYASYVIATIFGSLGEIYRPFTDFVAYQRAKEKKSRGFLLYIVIGLCIGIPIFFIVWLLLVSADMMFLKMTEKFFVHINLIDIFGILFTIIFMFFMAYCIMSFLCKRLFSEEYRQKKQASAILAITVTVPLALLYLVFSGVQIFCLFLGYTNLNQHTYAEYARQGFFQLLAVCLINLVLVLLGNAYFKENVFLKAILTIVSLCTYIMIASSAYRMILYIKHYYLTFLRIFVLWSLLVIFILLTGVIINIYKKNFPLFKYSMVVVTVFYLLLSFSHPDYWIAKCNVSNMGSNKSTFFDADAYQDTYYLTELSEDAAPAFAEYLKKEGYLMSVAEEGAYIERESYYDRYHYTSTYEIYGGSRSSEDSWGYYYMEKICLSYYDMGIRDFNLSKYIAYRVLEQ